MGRWGKHCWKPHYRNGVVDHLWLFSLCVLNEETYFRWIQNRSDLSATIRSYTFLLNSLPERGFHIHFRGWQNHDGEQVSTKSKYSHQGCDHAFNEKCHNTSSSHDCKRKKWSIKNQNSWHSDTKQGPSRQAGQNRIEQAGQKKRRKKFPTPFQQWDIWFLMAVDS